MSGKRPVPQTPSPKSGKISRITDYYKPIHHSERPKPSKRALEDEDEADGQSTKKLKTQQHAHTTHSFRTARLRVGVHTPSPRKTPAHTRLLDETDGGLADCLAGRYSAQDKKEAASPKNEHTKISLSDRLRNISKNRSTARPEKRPSSARLLDDVDGGVMDSVVGRFETTRYEGAEDNGDGNIEHDTLANDTCRFETEGPAFSR
ncbi:hypothetical protein N0V85_003963 [Neurospora sp. IMI 360204]|nr:hypothetical protein N0V85_003963 [Neurospora sp. IMI 360204]